MSKGSFEIKGISEEYIELLKQAGVANVVELAQRSSTHLYCDLIEINHDRNLVKVLPIESEVSDWINQAIRIEADRKVSK